MTTLATLGCLGFAHAGRSSDEEDDDAAKYLLLLKGASTTRRALGGGAITSGLCTLSGSGSKRKA